MISETHNMDCMNFMRGLPDGFFDLVIADPPYGSSRDAIGKADCVSAASKRGVYKQFDNKAPGASFFNEIKRVSKNQIVWGGNFFGLKGGVIAWDKKGTAFGEGEIAICSTHASVSFFELQWNGMLQGDMKNKEIRQHPTQKPVALYKWLLTNYAKPGQKIFDPMMGSQSSRIAAWDMGFDYYGCELDSDYYREGEARFAAHRAKPVLFAPEQMYYPEQVKLFQEKD